MFSVEYRVRVFGYAICRKNQSGSEYRLQHTRSFTFSCNKKLRVRLEIGIEEDETLKQIVIKKKLGFFGHVMRSDGLGKGIMLASGEVRRRRGRPRRERK